MATIKKTETTKTLKAAKTAEEMVESWALLMPGGDKNTVREVIEQNKDIFRPYIDKAPYMIEEFAQKPLYNMLDRGVFDPKTRELIFVAIQMALQRIGGLIFHIQAAICNGATEEEIMEIAFLTCYVLPKVQMGSISQGLTEGLRLAAKMKGG